MSCTDNSCGTGGWTGPQPGDPDLDNSILTATPAFGGIDVNWAYPVLNSAAVSHTILYRGITADFESAIQRAVVAGNHFYDKADADQVYYYWIRMVSVHGTLGALTGPASALAKVLSDDIMVRLTGQIDDGLLAESLKERLDQINILGTSLANEIVAREDGTTTLAEAIADAANGVAEALTFIESETASRVSGDAAAAEALTLVAASLGDDIASVSTSMSVEIDALNDTVDAMYTAKVTVNGLVGGFRIHNDGDEVDAGFDVDTFWVGRTSADKVKPFIISGGVVYMDMAMIRGLLSSTDYSPGVSGWGINNLTGLAEFNNITARGDIQANSLTVGSVYATNIVGGEISQTLSATGATGVNVTLTVPSGARSIVVIADGGYGSMVIDTDTAYSPNTVTITRVVDGGSPADVATGHGTVVYSVSDPAAGSYNFSLNFSPKSSYAALNDGTIVVLMTKR